jgi:hypothetical protein
MDWTIEKSRFDFQKGKDFSILDSSHANSGATQLHMQWVPKDRFSGVKWPELEADNCPSSVTLKMHGAITPLSIQPALN